LGKNGAGKSTLLRTIAGIRRLDSSVSWRGRPLHEISSIDLAKLRAFAEQVSNASDDWYVKDIVEAGTWPWVAERRVSEELVQSKVVSLIEQSLMRCDALHLADLQWRYLSGGEKQRVALAACLAQSTPVLILDEPTAHLDLAHQYSVMDELVRASQSCEQLLIASIHDLQLATRSFTHALVLNGDHQGSWVSGAVEEVLTPEVINSALGHRVEWVTSQSGERVLIAS
jgi:iron complex transport system ATP-binding protein